MDDPTPIETVQAPFWVTRHTPIMEKKIASSPRGRGKLDPLVLRSERAGSTPALVGKSLHREGSENRTAPPAIHERGSSEPNHGSAIVENILPQVERMSARRADGGRSIACHHGKEKRPSDQKGSSGDVPTVRAGEVGEIDDVNPFTSDGSLADPTALDTPSVEAGKDAETNDFSDARGPIRGRLHAR